MKAVFPCKGVVVLTKHNVDVLNNFYEDHLINSKMFSIYRQANYSVQVDAFNYLPQNSKIVLEDNTNLLTIKQLNEVLAASMKSSQTKTEVAEKEDLPIDDADIQNHPFFQTLKPID